MATSQMVYVVFILTFIDILFRKTFPNREEDGTITKVIRDFMKCFILFMVAYMFIVNNPPE